MTHWSPITHQVYRCLRRENVAGTEDRPLKLGVAVSGGADSVALLYILHDLAFALKLKLQIIHFHHGPGIPLSEEARVHHRDEAMHFTVKLARYFDLSKVDLVMSESKLTSERDMRDFRRMNFIRIQKEEGLDLIVTAHHSDDLLETRMMRLIRGTGRNGLKAIRARHGIWLRPLLELTHHDLVTELKRRKAEWVEDPSNKDPRYFRNWLRHVWLPQLEQNKPGSMKRMGRSFENLTDSSQLKQTMDVFLADNLLSRPAYLKLNVSEQKQSVAEVFFRLKTTDYSQSQVEEVRKRLDNSRTQHTFTVSGLEWRVNAEQISVTLADKGD